MRAFLIFKHVFNHNLALHLPPKAILSERALRDVFHALKPLFRIVLLSQMIEPLYVFINKIMLGLQQLKYYLE